MIAVSSLKRPRKPKSGDVTSSNLRRASFRIPSFTLKYLKSLSERPKLPGYARAARLPRAIKDFYKKEYKGLPQTGDCLTNCWRDLASASLNSDRGGVINDLDLKILAVERRANYRSKRALIERIKASEFVVPLAEPGTYYLLGFIEANKSVVAQRVTDLQNYEMKKAVKRQLTALKRADRKKRSDVLILTNKKNALREKQKTKTAGALVASEKEAPKCVEARRESTCGKQVGEHITNQAFDPDVLSARAKAKAKVSALSDTPPPPGKPSRRRHSPLTDKPRVHVQPTPRAPSGASMAHRRWGEGRSSGNAPTRRHHSPQSGSAGLFAIGHVLSSRLPGPAP